MESPPNRDPERWRLHPTWWLLLMFTGLITVLVILNQNLDWETLSVRKPRFEPPIDPPSRTILNEDSLRLRTESCEELAVRARSLLDTDDPSSDEEMELHEIGIVLRRPLCFEVAQRFRGFVIDGLGTTVRILDGPLQQSPVNPHRVVEVLRTRGCVDVTHRLVNAEPRPGILFSYREVTREYEWRETVYTQYRSYFFSTLNRSFAVTVHYPAECEESLSPMVERMLLSFRPLLSDDE